MKRLWLLCALLLAALAFAQSQPGQFNNRVSRRVSATPGVSDAGVAGAGGLNTQLQYNASGKLGGVGLVVTTDSLHANLVPEPSNPAAPGIGDILTVFGADAGTPGFPRYVDAFMGTMQFGIPGASMAWMDGLNSSWFCRQYIVDFSGLTALNPSSGGAGLATIGTAASTNWDAGSIIGRQHRVRNNSTTAVNAQAGWQSGGSLVWRGNTANAGGFVTMTRVALLTFPGSHVLVGYTSTTSVPTNNIEPSSLANTAYVGADGPDTTLHACSAGGTPPATCTDLGANFPKNGGFYDIWLFAQPNAGPIGWYVTRLDTVVPYATGVMTTNLPDQNAALAFHMMAENTDAGQAVGVDTSGFVECGNW